MTTPPHFSLLSNTGSRSLSWGNGKVWIPWVRLTLITNLAVPSRDNLTALIKHLQSCHCWFSPKINRFLLLKFYNNYSRWYPLIAFLSTADPLFTVSRRLLTNLRVKSGGNRLIVGWQEGKRAWMVTRDYTSSPIKSYRTVEWGGLEYCKSRDLDWRYLSHTAHRKRLAHNPLNKKKM